MTKITEVSSTRSTVSEIDYLKKFAKDMLRNSVFLGHFQERRYVESLNSYRDVVQIDDEEEEKFIENLMAVKERIENTFIKKPWVGITEPDSVGTPSHYCLWVILPEESPPLGKYWYRVKTVEISPQEVRLKLEIKRPFKESASYKKDVSDSDFFNFSKEDIRNWLKRQVCYSSSLLTFENIKETAIFTAVLLSTIVAGIINMIKYLLDYLLKFIREISNLIKACTPAIINFSNVFGRIVFGLYHLIVTLCHGKPNPQPVYNAYYNIDPQQLKLTDYRERYNQYYPKELPYYPQRRSGPTITPLDD